MKKIHLVAPLLIISTSTAFAFAGKSQSEGGNVSDEVIAKQREALAANTDGKGFGPQSPRDIDNLKGNNKRLFGKAPDHSSMNLCNIHIHKNAEHKGGDYTLYAGNGDGKGFNTGYRYTGNLTAEELTPFEYEQKGKYAPIQSGDTVEIHYVYSSAQVKPGPTLGACLSDSIGNPQLRVEAQVFVLVNDENALDFIELTKHEERNGYHQAINIPTNTGKPIVYAGSTTGPSYNEQGSPLQVTWSVRPKAAKVNIASVAKWFEQNAFNEDHAHGVRNLVENPELLSAGH